MSLYAFNDRIEIIESPDRTQAHLAAFWSIGINVIETFEPRRILHVAKQGETMHPCLSILRVCRINNRQSDNGLEHGGGSDESSALKKTSTRNAQDQCSCCYRNDNPETG